jgi:hypothetical protein
VNIFISRYFIDHDKISKIILVMVRRFEVSILITGKPVSSFVGSTCPAVILLLHEAVPKLQFWNSLLKIRSFARLKA